MTWNACMFSIMRDLTGKHFMYTRRKVCIEFAKRLDPDMGFYYFTSISSDNRFMEGERPDFDQKLTRSCQMFDLGGERPSNLIYGLATFPQPGAKSVHVTYHNLPIDATHHQEQARISAIMLTFE